MSHENFLVLLRALKFATKQSFKVKKKKEQETSISDELIENSRSNSYVPHSMNSDLHSSLASLMKTGLEQNLILTLESTIIVDPNAKQLFRNLEFSGKGLVL